MGLVVHTAPTVEPISLAEAKNHIRSEVDIPDDDSAISRMITSARKWCEVYRGESFVTTVWDWTIDRFPRARDRSHWCFNETILLPRPPLNGVLNIHYYDENGDLQLLDPALYDVDSASMPGRARPLADQCWPQTQCEKMNAVTIEFAAGYGATAASVPENIRDAILLLIEARYRHREPTAAELGTVKSLLDCDRLIRTA